jgi:hypothetical protein
MAEKGILDAEFLGSAQAIGKGASENAGSLVAGARHPRAARRTPASRRWSKWPTADRKRLSTAGTVVERLPPNKLVRVREIGDAEVTEELSSRRRGGG